MIIDPDQETLGETGVLFSMDYTVGTDTVSDGNSPGIGNPTKEQIFIEGCTPAATTIDGCTDNPNQ